jgi:predicted small integral membrane protein
MDTVFSSSHWGWRAITNAIVQHQTVFWLIVAIELVVAALCLWGSALRQPQRTGTTVQRSEGAGGG